MMWLEWLIWKYDRYMAHRKCRKEGHILTDPQYCLDGKYRYGCMRCTHRITTNKVVLSVVENDPSLSSSGKYRY